MHALLADAHDTAFADCCVLDSGCASCIDLARKLLDTNFTMKLRAHNFIPQIYLSMRAEDDAVGVFWFVVVLFCLVCSESSELQYSKKMLFSFFNSRYLDQIIR